MVFKWMVEHDTMSCTAITNPTTITSKAKLATKIHSKMTKVDPDDLWWNAFFGGFFSGRPLKQTKGSVDDINWDELK